MLKLNSNSLNMFVRPIFFLILILLHTADSYSQSGQYQVKDSFVVRCKKYFKYEGFIIDTFTIGNAVPKTPFNTNEYYENLIPLKSDILTVEEGLNKRVGVSFGGKFKMKNLSRKMRRYYRQYHVYKIGEDSLRMVIHLCSQKGFSNIPSFNKIFMSLITIQQGRKFGRLYYLMIDINRAFEIRSIKLRRLWLDIK